MNTKIKIQENTEFLNIKLNGICNAAVSAFGRNDVPGLYRNIADYIKAIDQSPALANIAMTLRTEMKRANTVLTNLLKKVDHEMDDAYNKMATINKAIEGDVHKIISAELKSYDMYREGNRQPLSHEFRQIHQYGSLCGVVRNLNENNYPDEAQDFALFDSGHSILEYTFSPTYIEFEQELRLYKEAQDDSIWGAFYSLSFVFSATYDKREMLVLAHKTTSVPFQLRFFRQSRELRRKLDNIDDGELSELNNNYFATSIERVNNFFVAELAQLEPVSPVQQSNGLTVSEINSEYMYIGFDGVKASEPLKITDQYTHILHYIIKADHNDFSDKELSEYLIEAHNKSPLSRKPVQERSESTLRNFRDRHLKRITNYLRKEYPVLTSQRIYKPTTHGFKWLIK